MNKKIKMATPNLKIVERIFNNFVDIKHSHLHAYAGLELDNNKKPKGF